jgi:hypothetical protein
MPRTEFLCDRCGVESHVFIDKGEDVYSGCQKIVAEHEKWSPECMGDLSTIRLLAPTESSEASHHIDATPASSNETKPS